MVENPQPERPEPSILDQLISARNRVTELERMLDQSREQDPSRISLLTPRPPLRDAFTAEELAALSVSILRKQIAYIISAVVCVAIVFCALTVGVPNNWVLAAALVALLALAYMMLFTPLHFKDWDEAAGALSDKELVAFDRAYFSGVSDGKFDATASKEIRRYIAQVHELKREFDKADWRVLDAYLAACENWIAECDKLALREKLYRRARAV